jgi:lysozyme
VDLSHLLRASEGGRIVGIRELLIKHEGLRLKPYRCTAGKLTIGVGRNLDDVGISEEEAFSLLDNDILRVRREAGSFAWFRDLSTERQNVILSMVFNLGIDRFKGFKRMIQAVSDGRFEDAATEMLNSKWAAQVGKRAVDLAEIMRSGGTP